MATAKVYNGSSWDTVVVKTYDGSGWEAKASFYDGADWQELYASGPEVNIQADGRVNYRFDETCYSGERFYSTGVEYEVTPSNGSFSKGNWLTSGVASEVWVEYTRLAGTQTNFVGKTAGTRYNLGSNESFYIQALKIGDQYKTIQCYFEMYDAASGGSLLDTSSTVWFTAEAENDGGGCPLCCFTPDTLVSMARGLDVPISSVRAGDMLMTPHGPRNVQEVIIRTNVPVYPLRFSDGRTIKITPDHPVLTERGPASLSQHVYKDIGIPEKLRVGDRVYTDTGDWLRLEHIGQEWKEPIVYTFSNSPFYANGLYVY